MTPYTDQKVRFDDIYSELALNQAALRAYTKPLFLRKKALGQSHDGLTLYDFAQCTSSNLKQIHRQLMSRQFIFREGEAIRIESKGKERIIYIFPWEERIVDLMLYHTLSERFDGRFSPSCQAYRQGHLGVDHCQEKVRSLLKHKSRPLYFIKRDVSNYFPTINHELLLEKLSHWIDPQDYLFDLLRQRIEFLIKNGEDAELNFLGIGFGTPIACFFANLYLNDMDHALDRVKGLHYFRYSDDMLAFSSNPKAVEKASAVMEEAFTAHKLNSKPSHHQDFQFVDETRVPQNTETWPVRHRFTHLGLEFRADKSVGLSREKSRKIQKLFRDEFRRRRRAFRHITRPNSRASKAISIAKDLIENGFGSVALIDYYLKHVNDQHQLKALDQWLAEEILSVAFRNGHKKGNFRKISFARLRGMGLPSLRHRHRLLHHGQMDYSFLTWRTDKLIEQQQRRLPAGRWRSTTTGFPPCPEAGTQNIPREGEGVQLTGIRTVGSVTMTESAG